jgi:WD40 repeat protein
MANTSQPSTTIIWRRSAFDQPGEPVFEQEKLRDISGAAFSRDGKIVALARCAVDPREGFCDRGEIRLWDVNAKKEKGEPLGGFHDCIRSLAFSNDGQVLATGGCGRWKNSRCIEGELRLWNAQTGYEIGEPIAAHTDEVKSLAFAGESGTLVSLGADGTVMLWNAPTAGPASVADSTEVGMISATLVQSVGLGKIPRDTGGFEFDGLSTVAFSRDGKLVAVNSCVDGRGGGCRVHAIDLWDETTDKPQSRVRPGFVGTAAVTFSSDARLLATGGRRLATGSAGEDSCNEGEIGLWETLSGELRSVALPVSGNRITALAFSPDGALLASGGCPKLDPWFCESSGVQLWSVAGSKTRGDSVPLDDFQISSLTFAPDGKFLVIAGCSERVMLEETRLCHATEVRVLSIQTLRQVGPPLANQSGWAKPWQ